MNDPAPTDPLAQSAPIAPSAELRIYTAAWLLPINAPPIKDGALAVAGSQITGVGSYRELQRRFPHAPVENLGLAALMPGLVNVHSHLELTVMRNFLEQLGFVDWITRLTNARRQLSETDLRASSIWGACEAVRAGITTLADTGDSGTPLDGLLALGLRGIVYQEVFGPDPAQASASINGLKEKVARLQHRTGELVRIGISPHTVYTVSGELFRAAAAYAGAAALPIAIHTAEARAEVELVRDGKGRFAEGLRRRNIPWQPQNCTVIEYLHKLGALEPAPLLIHTIQIDSQDLSLITGSGCGIAHCPKSNGKFGHGRAPLELMLAAGAKVGFGTDSVASNNICDLFEEARTGVFIHQSVLGEQAAFQPGNLLAMLTVGGAAALGLADQIGTLEAGKQADVIAVDLTDISLQPLHNIEAALIFCARARDVRLTMVAGRELYRDGQIKVVDETVVREQLIQAVEKIAG